MSTLDNVDSKTQGNFGIDKTIATPLEVATTNAGHLIKRENKLDPNQQSTILPAKIDTIKYNAELERKKQILNAKMLEIKQKKMNEETKFPSIQSRIKEVQSHFEFHNHDVNDFSNDIVLNNH